MATYYVAKNGSNAGNGSSDSPWGTISYAMRQNLQPGDEVVVRSGTYNESVLVSADGAAGQYITVRSAVPGGAKIVPPAGQPGVNINADYVSVDGFDVSGSTVSGITGIGVHHVKVVNNVVHDNVSNGIFLGRSEFLKVEGNTVYHNAEKGAASGIHIKAAFNVTGDTTNPENRIIVRNNVAYENMTEYGPRTDGNGISIDDFRNTQIAELPPYAFKTLVEGNITYSNSGRGVQIAWSDHVTVRGNIAYHNSVDINTGPWRGEISNMGSSSTRYIDNVAVTNAADNPGNVALTNLTFAGDVANKNVSWKGNLSFNGTEGVHSVHTNAGNTRPLVENGNQLGVNPGLSLADVRDLGEDLTGVPYVPGGGSDPPDPVVPDLWLTGTGGADVLVGGDGHDTISGLAGPDLLDGGAGNDVLVGGNGMDTLIGGAGNDTFIYKEAANAPAGAGEVIEDFATGDRIDLSEVDARSLTAGNQDFIFIGSAAFSGTAGELQYRDGVLGADRDGNGVIDMRIAIANGHAIVAADLIGVTVDAPPPVIPDLVLTGTAGADVLVGGAGHDTISGLAGPDRLEGRAGNDVLVGGNGMDTLIGGAGNDTFVYKEAANAPAGGGEVIEDFATGDRIDLAEVDARSLTAGKQDFVFIGSAAFSGTAGELQYRDGILGADRDGNGVVDMQIAIANGHAIVAEDLII